MREDMFKVIVERPRWGSRHAPKAKLRNDKVPSRKRATGRRQALEQHGYTKCLNENLAPLKRYLMKQVGRPWDKVYSEISEHLDPSHTVKQHVRDHLTDFVMVKVTVDRQGRFLGMRSEWSSPMPPEHWWAKLYVDPNDGLIKRTDKLCRKLGVQHYRDKYRESRKRRAQGLDYDHNLRVLTETRFLVKQNTCWFQLDTDVPPEDAYGRRVTGRDLVALLTTPSSGEAQNWKLIAKHQLSKKALKAQKLSNG
ncbi:MAG: hypothetical protein AAFV59_05290 [Pseudomonadota bacterium]